MKKILKVLGILLIILLIIILIPFAFKGKIADLVNYEAAKMLNATLRFENLNLSLIRSFPNASVSLRNLCIVGVDVFENDTLLFAEKAEATVNVMSLFGKSGFEVSKVNVEKGFVHAIVLKDGKVNWDIVKQEDPGEAGESSASNFKLLLKSVTVKNMDVLYDDATADMKLVVADAGLNLSGDMTADNTVIDSKLRAASLSFFMSGIPYVSEAKAAADVKLDADFKNSKYTFSNNALKLNEIGMELDGWFAMPSDTVMEMDLRLQAPKTQFKDILSMIPAIYTNDFKEIEASGEVLLEATVKGIMDQTNLPAFDVKAEVANAVFQYNSLPQAVKNISLKTLISNPGGSANNTVIDIPAFHLEMAGNPFDMSLNVKNIIEDPAINLAVKGMIDFDAIKEIYPLKDMDLSGKLDMNLQLASQMSFFEKNLYDRIGMSGSFHAKELAFKGTMKDDVLIDNALLRFSPRTVSLDDCTVKIGKNDLSFNGELENVLLYLLKNQELDGKFTVRSNYLNLNDFMPEATADSRQDTLQTDAFVIPANLDLSLNGDFKQLLFGQLDMSDITGSILIKNGKAELKDLKMKALGGNLAVHGYYDSSIDPKQPETSLTLDIRGASFTKMFESFETVRQFAPVFEVLTGNFSSSFQMKTLMGANFLPQMQNLSASGLLQSENVEVKDMGLLNQLASTLKYDNLKDMIIKDLDIPFSINDGRLTTKPFDLNFADGKMNLSGSTGLDQTIDYLAKVHLSEKLTKGYLNEATLKIGGTFASPKISVVVADLAGQVVNQIAGAVLNGNDSVSTQEKISEEVTKQADAIRERVRVSSEQLISEAEKRGQQLIDEANKTQNPLAKAAAVTVAQQAANKLKEEAVKQSDKLKAEAEKEISDLESKAKSQTP
ncbi:MAG: AsmA family protein [Dysgonamonadaceae bacterium]|jgi:hypothetical protein|nr:AsmA family protein [Dysgonamonadaceae bacterium]